MSFGGSFGGGFDGGGGDKSLKLSLAETFRLAWADPELRARLQFVLLMFAVFTLGVHIPVPIGRFDPATVMAKLEVLPIFQQLDAFGGGALRRLSIFALSLNPYITGSIIIQILTTALPAWKKEMEEGGQHARQIQNRKTRILTLILCFVQGWGLLQLIRSAIPLSPLESFVTLVFWTAGTMFTLWIGEQISERGIGNGVSLIIFAGIIVGLPHQLGKLFHSIQVTPTLAFGAVLAALIFLGATWVIVYFTTAQRRIPIQHMKRMQGTRAMGGGTSYLPLSVNMAGVLPIIFAISLVGLPSQAGILLGGANTPLGNFFTELGEWLNPASTKAISASIPIHRSIVGLVFYTGLIFFFTY
ncbi:preprotein translocase subunit SecY, partial [bacterium]